MAEPLRVVSNDAQHEQEASADNSTHVEITRDGTHHETTTLDGHTVNFQSEDENTTRVKGQWSDEADEHVRGLIEEITSEREARENLRANKRNFNRMMTLLGALVIGLFVTYSLTNGWWGSYGPTFAPYAFCITILLDSGLAAYSYVKHY